MFKIRCRRFLLVIVFSFEVTYCSLTFGSEIVFPASQIQQGKGSICFFYSRTSQKVNLQTKNKDEIKVGGYSYFSNVTNDFETDAFGENISVKAIFNPWNGFNYWLKAGSCSYEFEIPSATVKNKLSSQERGLVIGAGICSVLFPDTIVTPAIAFGVGINYSSYGLDNFMSDSSIKQQILNKMELVEIQSQIIISKKMNKFEPYTGMKIYRTYATLTDKISFGKVDGIKDTASIFIGSRFKIYPKESLVVEYSALSDTNITIGWNLEF